jgi:hypothetical protein
MRLGIRFSIFVIVLQSAMIEFLSESDPSVAKISPEQVINHAIMKRLDDSGFIDHPFGK